MLVISGAMVDREVAAGTRMEATLEAMVDRGMVELNTRQTLTLVMVGVALTKEIRTAIAAVVALTMCMVLGTGS